MEVLDRAKIADPTELEKLSPLEAKIADLESELGLTTPLKKATEAALLIDNKFIQAAVIRGDKAVERLFGDGAWADWLNIRKLTKDNLGNPLTPDFIKQAHIALSENSNPKIGGVLRTGEVCGGDYKFLGQPVTFSDTQHAAIENNPLLGFLQAGSEQTRGLIVYPNRSFDIDSLNLSEKARAKFETGTKSTRSLMEVLLEDTCDWYNAEKANPDHDPFKLAKELQLKLISSHLFLDFSGRLSRALMNWSLESDGKAPAILEDPGDDILVDSETWREKVEEGSIRHAQAVKKVELLEKAGIENLAELYDLSEMQSFYHYVFSKIAIVPEIRDEDIMDHSPYNLFVQSFVKEFVKFKSQYSAKREIKTTDGNTFILSQGGLVPQFYLDLIRSGAEMHPEVIGLVKDAYLHQEVVFRGGQALEKITDSQGVLRLLTTPVNLGGDYRSIGYGNPLSLRAVDRTKIAATLDEYNKLLANSYLTEQHPELADIDPTTTNTLSKLIQDHIQNNGIQKSPYASTSFSYRESVKWARDHSIGGANTQTGVLYELSAPTFGGVCTFSATGNNYSDIPHVRSHLTFEHEKEMLIPGGVLPGMVEAVTVFDKQTAKETFHARRFQKDGEAFVVVVEAKKTGNEVRVYTFDPATKGYTEVSEQDVIIADAHAALQAGERAKSRDIVTSDSIFSGLNLLSQSYGKQAPEKLDHYIFKNLISSQEILQEKPYSLDHLLESSKKPQIGLSKIAALLAAAQSNSQVPTSEKPLGGLGGLNVITHEDLHTKIGLYNPDTYTTKITDMYDIKIPSNFTPNQFDYQPPISLQNSEYKLINSNLGIESEAILNQILGYNHTNSGAEESLLTLSKKKTIKYKQINYFK